MYYFESGRGGEICKLFGTQLGLLKFKNENNNIYFEVSQRKVYPNAWSINLNKDFSPFLGEVILIIKLLGGVLERPLDLESRVVFW